MIQELLNVAGQLAFMVAIAVIAFFGLRAVTNRLEEMRERYGLDLDSRFEELRIYWDTEPNLRALSLMASLVLGALGLWLPLGIFGVLFGAITGWLAVPTIHRYTQNKRTEKLGSQLVSALTLMADGMRAGESFTQAIDTTRANSPRPMSEELSIISGQVRLGVPLAEALDAFAARVPLSDVRIATQAIRISLSTGAALPHALQQIADTIRNRGIVHGKIDALTAQGKAQGLVAGVVPFALAAMFYVMDPSYMEVLFNTFLGNCVVAFVIVMQVAAFFVIRNIVRIDI